MTRIISLLLLTVWMLSGCGPVPAPEATATPVVVGVLPLATPAAENIPTPLCPNPDCIYITPSVKNPETLRFDLPTRGAEPVSAWRPPQYAVPLSLSPFDHFYFARPIAADQVNWPAADYRYGGTFVSKTVTHTGVDIDAKYGVPVLAAGAGTVIWAGWGLFSSSPGNLQDPYGIAVAIRHDFGYQGKQLYTIYAHMSAVDVAIGQWVDSGTQLGRVGATGHVTGPHLHFEVRLGENTFLSTRNPELWLAPPQGWGVLAGRIMGDNAKLSNSQPITIESLSEKHQWVVNTYGPGAAIHDSYYNENMVISDLPAGDYMVTVVTYAVAHKLKVTIHPGRVTFFSYQNVRGFSITPPPAPTVFMSTPVP